MPAIQRTYRYTINVGQLTIGTVLGGAAAMILAVILGGAKGGAGVTGIVSLGPSAGGLINCTIEFYNNCNLLVMVHNITSNTFP